MILSEMEDTVGADHVSINAADKLTYGIDYFWISRMWADKGRKPPQAEFIVRPGSTQDVSKTLKTANYYKLPVQT